MRYRKKLEFRGNQRASIDPTWSELVVRVRDIPLGLISPRGFPVVEAEDVERIEAILWERFRRPLADNYLVPARFLVPQAGLEIIRKHGVPHEDLSLLLRQIDDLRIPAGSAHGDAHLGNFIIVGDKIRAIDWTAFEEHSSPLFDLLYWYADRYRREADTEGQAPLNLHDQILTIPPNWRNLDYAYPDMQKLQVYFVLTRVITKFRVKRNPLKPKNARICSPLITLIEQIKKPINESAKL